MPDNADSLEKNEKVPIAAHTHFCLRDGAATGTEVELLDPKSITTAAPSGALRNTGSSH